VRVVCVCAFVQTTAERQIERLAAAMKAAGVTI
jgi:hypothetical protein